MGESSPHPWELAWKEGRWQELSPPLPAVSEFTEYLKEVGAKTVLDLGCGAGRHAIFLARAGFQVTGLDVSETALVELHGRLAKAGLANVSLVKHEMSELPFIDEYFDALVSTNVLHHGTMSEIKRALGEAHRVIKRNGVAFVVTLSKKDFRYGNGKRLEPDTYLFAEGDEEGILHHFFSREELLSYFGQFEVLSLKEELILVERGSRAHFHLRLKKQ